MALTSLVMGLLFPPGILLVGLVFAAVASGLGRHRVALALMTSAVCITLVLSIPWLADRICEPLERQALRDSQAALATRALPRTAVVLGGAIGKSGLAGSIGDSGYNLFDAADRVAIAARLWRTHQVDRLVLAGGSADETSEAELMARFAADLGVPRSAMLLESDSRNTRENARGVGRVLQANRLGPDVALVTSGLHLPRAMIEFRCAGLAPVGVPAEIEALGTVYRFLDGWLPSAAALDRSRRSLKEWLGMIVAGC